MTRISLLAVAALSTIGLAASLSPASAATIASCRDDRVVTGLPGVGDNVSQIDSNSQAIIAALRAKGTDVQSISDWGGCVRAEVVGSNGQTELRFFDPDTLQQLSRG